MNSWLRTKGDTRTIKVECHDNEDGSGCVKDTYIKTFDTEMIFGTITISDNAGNTADCLVRVNIDWTYPTLTVTAYKRTATGGKGIVAASASADHDHPKGYIHSTDYIDNVGGWLNRDKYSNGVVYEYVLKDNVQLSSGLWQHNKSGIYDSSSVQFQSFTTLVLQLL